MTPQNLLEPPLARVIYRSAEIFHAVQRLAGQIVASTPRDAELTLLVVLEGARRFGDDLHAALLKAAPVSNPRITLATVRVGSYGHELVSNGQVRILSEPTENLQGRHVVIVDDIVDRGYTLDFLRTYCHEAKPVSLQTCVLFAKRDVRRTHVPDFVGLEVPAVFVVGYGLDYQEKFRNLPYLAALDEASVSRKVATGVQTPSGQREKA